MRRSGLGLLSAIILILLDSLAAGAPTKRPLVITPDVPLKARPGLGNYVFGLASGPPWSMEFAFAGQLAALASMGQEGGPHGESGPRIAPLVTEAGSRTISDLLSNSTTDLAIVPLPALVRAARDRPGVKARIGYVAPLYLQEVHVVARADIDDLSKLRGRQVALGAAEGVGAMLFQDLGIPVNTVEIPPDAALSRLANGDIDAVVLVSGKPIPALAGIESSKDLHLVPIPYSERLQGDFLPTEFSRSDYPGLVRSDTSNSLAVQSVLAAYIWPSRTERAQLLATLVTSVLDHVADPNVNFGGRWTRDVNWAATLPGWKRLAAAQRWLEARAKPRQDTTGATTSAQDKGTR